MTEIGLRTRRTRPNEGSGADQGPISVKAPAEITDDVLRWYDTHARDLPWRRPGTSAWAVLVSEVMLQQTPVARVIEPWTAWLDRWPTPAALAAEPSSAAVHAWGRLGYPRRALRLHAAAVAITAEHDGIVPGEPAVLRTLPGVGEYTAAAVAAFAYGRRIAVLDTNVRRVLARLADGSAQPPPSLTHGERALADEWLPNNPAAASRWGVAAMEFGALVCTSRAPRCSDCPVAGSCAWRGGGYPPSDTVRRTQAWHGTDRQCRGHLLGIVRDHPSGIDREDLLDAWPARAQAERSLAGLISDGLVSGTNLILL